MAKEITCCQLEMNILFNIDMFQQFQMELSLHFVLLNKENYSLWNVKGGY